MLNINEKYMYYIRITGILIIITACVALILGVVNALTVDKIEENRIAEFMAAVEIIFPDSDNIDEMNINTEPPVGTVYNVSNTVEQIGYCIKVLPKGFDGEIELIVGLDMTGKICGVQIVSHSETPGLGSRVADDDYLKSYNGMNDNIRFGHGVEAIAGATITSKAVLSGINAALDTYSSLISGGEAQ